MRTVKMTQHNVYQIHYHFVTPVKYRKAIFGNLDREQTLHTVCTEIEERYSIEFEQVGNRHESRPLPSRRSPKVLSFTNHPDLRRELWGGELWTDGFFIATVGEGGNRDVIRAYVAKQGMPQDQFKLFDFNH